jgi:Zn-dependent protease
MNDSIRLGRVAGIRVGLNWTLLVVVALVAGGLADNRFVYEAPGYSTGAYVAAGALTAVGLFLGVLAHEFGHALVARRVGLSVDGITLSWMGGVTRIEGDAPRPRSELLISGVGPLISLLLGGALWGLRLVAESASAGSLVVSALGWLAGINVILAVFNLLPAAPLDGGRVLHSMVWAATHDRWKATRVASTAGMALGGLLAAAGFLLTTRTTDPVNGFFIALIGWWLLGSARAERSVGAVHQALDGVSIAEVMRPVGAAPGWVTVRNFADTYLAGRPGWVWMLEEWGGGYGGLILGDAIAAVPLPQWDIARPIDFAVPISASAGAAPNESALEVLNRTRGKQMILIVDQGRTVGAVLPSDIEALVKLGGRRPVQSNGWSLTRG